MDFRTFEKYSEELWTILVKATSKEIFKFEESMNLTCTVYPMMKSCYIVCDNHAVQIFRDKFNIEQEFPGDFQANKKHYEIKLSMKNDSLHVIRNKRLQTFLKSFHHAGLYNIKCYSTYNTESHRMTYDLLLDSYDTRDNVIEYLKASFNSGFSKEDLLLENNFDIIEDDDEKEFIHDHFNKLAKMCGLGKNVGGGADWSGDTYYLTTDKNGDFYVTDNDWDDTYSIMRKSYDGVHYNMGTNDEEDKVDVVYTTDDILEIMDLAKAYKSGQRSK